MRVYANEWDASAAHWLSCLPISFDWIDDRSIKDVQGHELTQFDQCHFFSGIAGWPLALQLANWPEKEPVWTGSCPCQPFSAAGKRQGTNDDRHLWPEFYRLIDECRPTTIFGEQVASKAGRDWLATVRTDLEALGYAVGAADLCAAGVGAPHIRQRLFWVAHCNCRRLQKHVQLDGHPIESQQQPPCRNNTSRCREDGRLADTGCNCSHTRSRPIHRVETQERSQRVINHQSHCGLGNSESWRRCERIPEPQCSVTTNEFKREAVDRSERSGAGCWGDVEYIPCRDGKARPVKPGVRLLAHGIPGRVAQLRGLGNAIVPQVAAEFIAAFMESAGMTES